ncbi:MAG: hypothetical protein ABI647_03285 [Gemmatimonadota bacterium]
MNRIARLTTVLLVGASLGRLAAQDTVRVGITYPTGVRPTVVVLPTAGLDSVRAIIARDLEHSDRFEVVQLPPGGANVGASGAGTINYPLLKTLGANLAVELVLGTGQVTARLYDLITQQRRDEITVPADPSGQGESRMDIHRISDEIVRLATGLKGIAATRILYLNNNDKRVYRVDSDGYGPVALSPQNVLAISPAWMPDGAKVAYTQLGTGGPGPIVLQSLATGTRVVVPTTTEGQNITPAFSPDGRKMVFSRLTEQGANLYSINVADLCCVERLTAGRFAENLSPAYSPDGRRIVFVSTRSGSPQIYVMSADGTDQELLVSFDFGSTGNSYAPEWSPDGAAIVFHRDISGAPQICTFDIATRQVRVRTSGGRNEDPSWGPDGRHVVFVSNRTGRAQLHVLDTETGTIRMIPTPGAARLPSWSRPLVRGR